MGVKSTVTNLVTNPSQLFQRGLACRIWNGGADEIDKGEEAWR